MTTFTEGPYEARPWGDRGDIAVARVGYMPHARFYPALCAAVPTEEDKARAQADARAYLALPDLVAALEKVHANAAESPEWIRMVTDAALAKVKG